LTRFDAIFTLNQDLLLEIHYQQVFGALPRWNGVLIPGMRPMPPAAGTRPFDATMYMWRPTDDFTVHQGSQPYFKLHGSSNWETEKSSAFRSFDITTTSSRPISAKVMRGASRERGLGTYLVNPNGRNVLRDPKMERAAIDHIGISITSSW
jgi:hypothetical protein